MTLKETLYQVGLGLKAWLLPSFFYSAGLALSLRTLVEYRLVGFEYFSKSQIIQEWILHFDSGTGLDLGRLIDSSSGLSFYLPWTAVFALVFLVLAYKLTPK